MNPFKYGQVVSNQDYCQRPELTRQLSNYIKSGQNVLMQGERRTGKTSLIFETCRYHKKKQLLFIDLLEVKSLEDIVRRFANAWISLEQRKGLLERILKRLAHLRPKLTLDPMTGEPSWELDTTKETGPESLEGFLDLIERKGQFSNCIVVFDEFQDILNLGNAKQILAIMRSKIQFHRKTPYIFAGSIRNKMDEIFYHPDSAFFKSALPLSVGDINRADFIKFLTHKFKTGGRCLDQNLWDAIFSLAENNPGDVQQVCSALWDVTKHKQNITIDCLTPATQLVLAQESKTYESLLVPITGIQFRCLVGLAKNGPHNPMSARFLSITGIKGATSVHKALMRLSDLKIIFATKDGYKFTNPFFKQWLLFKKY